MTLLTEERLSPPAVPIALPQPSGAALPTDSQSAAASSSGSAAATVLAVGIGVFVLGLCSILGDALAPVAARFNWVPRTGPLSGVTGCAVALWLLSWWGLHRLWSTRPIDLKRINAVAALLFVLGLLLSFPPFMDLLQGK